MKISLRMNTSQTPLDWLADRCRTHLLNEKWLMVENLRIGHQWKDRLTLSGHSAVNLHAKTLTTIAVELSQSALAKRNLRYVGTATASMLVRQILGELLDAQQLQYFTRASNLDSLATLVTRSLMDLRLADLDAHILDKANRANGFESKNKAADLQLVFEEYTQRLTARRLVDYAGCLRLATAGILDSSIATPNALVVLFPEEIEQQPLETQLLAALTNKAALIAHSGPAFHADAARLRIEAKVSQKQTAVHYFSGLGEANEVRRAAQLILTQSGRRLDEVELLHTDYQSYVPVIMEQLSLWLATTTSTDQTTLEIDQLPVTFAEGIACAYSRPGRALRAWIRWLRSECPQTKAVQMLREGLLVRPESKQPIGYSRLANTLRSIPIGFQLDRYLPQIDRAIRNAHDRLDEYHRKVANGEEEADDRGPDWDAGLGTLQVVRSIWAAIVELVPTANDNTQQVLRKARRFLLYCSRAESKLDRIARAQLLDDIEAMLESITLIDGNDLDVFQWLEDLPIESRILASSPQPGCIHVTDLATGGYSGRKHLFVLGLDDSRYPRRATVDPILLDSERQALSGSLPTARTRSENNQQALIKVLDRTIENHSLSIGLAYSTRNLAEDRTQFPSPALLELFRLTNDKEAQITDLLKTVGKDVSFVCDNETAQLSPTEVMIAELLYQPDKEQRRQRIETVHPHLESNRIANAALSAAIFGAHDSYVPEAGVALDPTASSQRISANRLETFGTCPRRYFFKYGLQIFPPDKFDIDPERWLDALQFGSLIHEVFEEFLRRHTEQNLIPNQGRDLQPLLELLQVHVDAARRDTPPPNEDAYLSQLQELRETCGIFLQKEEAYCAAFNARPWVLEASIGLKDDPRTEIDCAEPVALKLNDGRVLRVGGRIDRIDRLESSGSERYAIWDYKSGSDWGFDQADPFRGGRKLQPYLYLGMLRHRISAVSGNRDAVASFGYFFPSAKTEGRRIQWTVGDLRSGDAVLSHISDLIQRGAFIATSESEDCNYCDYKSVCGDPKQVTLQAKTKATEPCNQQLLLPWIELRELQKK
ncbi:MAG: PD-(D/E)XK nuclease family protein [Pirellulaceae bacterium]|nr:PD-(D/E)XK nuclease family protein [Pirellulaceae bacterium]